MRPKETERTTQFSAPDDFANMNQRRWVSTRIVAFHVFAVTYVVFVVRFDHWGLALGWMPATIIAAAFGWFGYFLPWIGEVIAILWDVTSILSVFS
jgi:hypothetical protein